MYYRIAKFHILTTRRVQCQKQKQMGFIRIQTER